MSAQCGVEDIPQELTPRDQDWVALGKSLNYSESAILDFLIQFKTLCIIEFSDIYKSKENDSKMNLSIYHSASTVNILPMSFQLIPYAFLLDYVKANTKHYIISPVKYKDNNLFLKKVFVFIF